MKYHSPGLLQCFVCTVVITLSVSLSAETIRARDLGVPFEGSPGPLNSITDISGIEVGHITLIEGEGALQTGKGPVRTGVTIVHPRGKDATTPVFAGWFTLNASGEMTGTTWLEERGLISGPIAITNTHSVGVVRDASVGWMVDHGWPEAWHAPVVGETYDGALNDINGFHVTRNDALIAMQNAEPGAVTEGAVGGGTGMICNGFKGGIGTSSRVFELDGKVYTVGVLVQCNYNWSGRGFRMGGRMVSDDLSVEQICFTDQTITRHVEWFPYCEEATQRATSEPVRDGSIIIIVATDAPLLPHQLRRVAKRPSLGLGRLGAISEDGSGDIFVAFSTANEQTIDENQISKVAVFPNNDLSAVFAATAYATEEAVVNAMVAAETVVGVAGLKVEALPEDQVEALFK